MIEQEIDINKIAAATVGSLQNCVGFLAAELADILIIKAPVETGRMVRSINVNDGNNPRLTDTYRETKVERNVAGLKARQKRNVLAQVRRRMNRRGKNRLNETWWITAAAPYSGHVHSGAATRQRIKNMPRRQQRAAWANMKDKMNQRGQSEYQRKTGEGHNFFSFTPAEKSRAAANAVRRNKATRVNV